MGWVSTLEDIVDRANDSMHMSEHQLRNRPQDGWSELQLLGDKQRQLEAARSQFRKEVEDLSAYLELATDPTLDLALEAKELRERNAFLEDENACMRLLIEEQQRRLEGEDRLRQKAEREERLRKESERQLKLLTKTANANRRGR